MIDIPAETLAIIFDCDGTLTDSMPAHFLAWRATFERHGIAFSEERFYAMGGMPSDRIIATLAEENGKQLDPSALSVEKEQAFLDCLDHVRPVEKVVELARSQRGQRKLAVASGGFRWVIDHQLQHIGLANGDGSSWFDAIVTAEDTERHKPHPDVFLKAAELMGVDPAACLVFEDADLGVEAAARAGMPVVDVRQNGWGSSSA